MRNLSSAFVRTVSRIGTFHQAFVVVQPLSFCPLGRLRWRGTARRTGDGRLNLPPGIFWQPMEAHYQRITRGS
jgi:hypothetical protein